MSDHANRWTSLLAQIEEGRTAKSLSASEVQNGILRTLKVTAEHGHCSRNVQGWLHTTKTSGGCKKIELALGDTKDAKQRPAIKLHKLEHLEDGAMLAFWVTVSERAPKGIRAYTACLRGTTRQTRVPWYARIDLSERAEGHGLCAHALLHCHMGTEPHDGEDADALADAPPADAPERGSAPRRSRIFSPRVPLPWLHPWDALQWLLAIAEPGLEPAAALT